MKIYMVSLLHRATITSGHALPKLGLCNAKSQCHTKY